MYIYVLYSHRCDSVKRAATANGQTSRSQTIARQHRRRTVRSPVIQNTLKFVFRKFLEWHDFFTHDPVNCPYDIFIGTYTARTARYDNCRIRSEDMETGSDTHNRTSLTKFPSKFLEITLVTS